MIGRVTRYFRKARSLQLINIALARAAATSAVRSIDLTDPLSWEFSGFSQHGEDGIIDILTSNLSSKNNYFVEIGTGDATENNTSFLAIARRYSGMMVEGDASAAEWCEYLLRPINYGLDFLCMFVTRENVASLRERILFSDPDLFSLDIDGNDFWVADSLLKEGVRPKIAVVEYNSAFGPERLLSIPYNKDFRVDHKGRYGLYYGCSIAAWRALFDQHRYTFVSVESSGTNAFFLDPAAFDADFVRGIRGLNFRENHSQMREYRRDWVGQFDLIKNLGFEQLP
jgi:hypothetical protein